MCESIRGSRGLWFTDNIAALMALVNGKSDSPSLDVIARFMHIACFAMRAAPYFDMWSQAPIGQTRLAERA